MQTLFLSCSVIAGSIVLLVSCDAVSHDPPSSPTSTGPPGPAWTSGRVAQPEVMSSSPETPQSVGLTGGSQESGFSSEENEDTKGLPPVYWDEGGEVNGTSMDPGTLEGFSPASFQPSSSHAEAPTEQNSSSPLVPLVESLDSDLWEIQGESSGSPAGPGYGPSTVEAGSPAQTTTDPDVGLMHHWGRASGQTTSPPSAASQEEEGLSQTSAEDSTAWANSVQPGHPFTIKNRARGTAPAGSKKGATDHMHQSHLTAVPPSPAFHSPSVAFSGIAWDEVAPTFQDDQKPELRHGGTELLSESKLHNTHLSPESPQVICVDWSDLTGKGYVILNMSENYDCDDFRAENDKQLLDLLEEAFSQKMNSPRGSWLVSLSKPTRQDRQLLMTLASDQGVIATKDVLSMLGEIRRGLLEIGIQNFTSVSSCQARPSQTRSDYGKLFVVLVIIGSICVVIIASGLIYICWQRRLPKMKNMSRGEELHFVENGCHDNPTLDVTSDGQSEMQEKKHSANGVVAGCGGGGGGGGGGWQVLVNKPAKEVPENMEEDTHL
ncbi:podocalyxin-like protein 2 [Brienomyrus brachyistius]|uniref:podocalyxin-like protein 2 n=1 Tax=Brienomyrus brachyistius TaxID=42636 RepID=UPI0020B23F05|nr:podocalyxin-like protein 2 [Brienomyrus brachyistius]